MDAICTRPSIGYRCVLIAGHEGLCALEPVSPYGRSYGPGDPAPPVPRRPAYMAFMDANGQRHYINREPRPLMIACSEGDPHSYDRGLHSEKCYKLALHYGGEGRTAFLFEFRESQRHIRDRIVGFLAPAETVQE